MSKRPTLSPLNEISPLRGKVVCVRADELTDPALQVGRSYDLLEIVRYGSVEFYRVGVRGLWGVLNLSHDFVGVGVPGQRGAQARERSTIEYDRAS